MRSYSISFKDYIVFLLVFYAVFQHNISSIHIQVISYV